MTPFWRSCCPSAGSSGSTGKWDSGSSVEETYLQLYKKLYLLCYSSFTFNSWPFFNGVGDLVLTPLPSLWIFRAQESHFLPSIPAHTVVLISVVSEPSVIG